MPPIQTAREKRLTTARPLDCAYDWGHDEHLAEALRHGRRRDDMPARNQMARNHTARLGIHQVGFGVGESSWAMNMVGTIPAMLGETSGAIMGLPHWRGIIQGQREEQPAPAELQELAAIIADAEIEASPLEKRRLTCLLAMYMPAEGVDENLGSALDCWNFYVDQPPAPAVPAASPSTETVKVVGVRTSPGMAFEG